MGWPCALHAEAEASLKECAANKAPARKQPSTVYSNSTWSWLMLAESLCVKVAHTPFGIEVLSDQGLRQQ